MHSGDIVEFHDYLGGIGGSIIKYYSKDRGTIEGGITSQEH